MAKLEKGEGRAVSGGGSRGLWFYVVVLIIGALMGTVMGEVIAVYAQTGLVHDVFVKGVDFGLAHPLNLDLKVFNLTFGATVKLNLASVLGMILAAFLVRKI